MVNEERTKLMTKAEIFRSREERRALRINRYNAFDYISFYMILCAIGFLIGCALLAVFVAGVNVDVLLKEDAIDQLYRMCIFGAVIGCVLLVLFLCIAYQVYRRRYIRSKDKVKDYRTTLKQIHQLSEAETQKVWRESEEYKE